VPQFAHQIRVGSGYFSLLRCQVLAGAYSMSVTSQAPRCGDRQRNSSKGFLAERIGGGQRILIGAPRPGAKWMEIVALWAMSTPRN